MKVKATFTFTREYELKLKNYPEGWTVEQMIEEDKIGLHDDPFLFLDNPDVKLELTIEQVPS